jgi:hypothetical protein
VGPSQSRSLISYFNALSSLHNALHFLRLVPLRMVTGLDLSPLYLLTQTSGKRSSLSSAHPNVCDGIARRLPCRLGTTRFPFSDQYYRLGMFFISIHVFYISLPPLIALGPLSFIGRLWANVQLIRSWVASLLSLAGQGRVSQFYHLSILPSSIFILSMPQIFPLILRAIPKRKLLFWFGSLWSKLETRAGYCSFSIVI